MRFVGREAEIKKLKEVEELSKRKMFAIALYGIRRVGKTRLMLEFLKDRGLYFFVNKNKASSDLLLEFQNILKEKKILGELETVQSWDKFFETILTRKTPPIVFDEFQNFAFVEPSAFGTLQKTIDLNENKPGFIILSGSFIGMIKKLFQSSKEPLYGRIKKSVKLNPLPLSSCLEIGRELRLGKEELIKIYMLFGGYPKYYVTIEDFNLQGKTAEQIIDALFLSKNAPLEEEVGIILSQEFGRRSEVYYSILEAIAGGNNTLSSIAGYLNTPMNSITRQINEIKNQFELIELELPYKGKRGFYRIKHPLSLFWFSQVYRSFSDYASRNPEFINKVKKNLNSYYGRRFEEVAKEFLVQKLKLVEAKRQWGRIQNAAKDQSTYEIDLIGRNKENTYAFEFKWQAKTKKQALKTLQELKDKVKNIRLIDARLGIVAKKIIGKEEIRKQGFLAYDLDDF